MTEVVMITSLLGCPDLKARAVASSKADHPNKVPPIAMPKSVLDASLKIASVIAIKPAPNTAMAPVLGDGK